jgi:hypothetical protein
MAGVAVPFLAMAAAWLYRGKVILALGRSRLSG